METNDDSRPLAFIKNDAGGVQQGYWKDVFPTMRTGITPAIARRECFSITPCDANGTRRDRLDGGMYITRAEASKTLTRGNPNTETVVVEPPVISLDGDKLGKAERGGGSGLGVSAEDVMYTQTAKDVHAVAYGGQEVREVAYGGECVPIDLRNATRDADRSGEGNRQGTGVGEDGAPAPTVTANPPGVGWRATVRRLMPVETERLMGFPDGWTRIHWKGRPPGECPDAPRYKACGNSMCVNVMRWIGIRIENEERRIRNERGEEHVGDA
ncbi:MAG: DNA cytosine methyltransferase [Oligosphaeraceae bacterium]